MTYHESTNADRQPEAALTTTTTQHVVLVRVPGSRVRPTDFEVRSDDSLGDRRAGEVTVAARYFGLNAGLATRLGTGRSTGLGPALSVGDTPKSDAIGIVTDSDRDEVRVGDMVTGLLPWAQTSHVDGSALRVLPTGADPVRWLTILGHVGATAHTALISVGRLQRGETVWISAAAGGVGCCAVQIAQRVGAHVIASAGSEARRDYLIDVLGVGVVVDRRADLGTQLQSHAPTGLDLYLDFVGGDHLRAAITQLRDRGRVVVAGRVGDPSAKPVLADTANLIGRRLSLTGMSVTDHPNAHADLQRFVESHEGERDFIASATVGHGLADLPRAFCSVLAGEVLGRGIVDVGSLG